MRFYHKDYFLLFCLFFDFKEMKSNKILSWRGVDVVS